MQDKFCERLPVCPFFRVFQETDEMLDVLNEYVKVYCCGPLHHKCYRNVYFALHGVMPADNISPSGLDFRKYI
jgi:hypothetical protein